MCVVQILLSWVSREYISLTPLQPACFYSFLYTFDDFLWSMHPHTIVGCFSNVGGLGWSRLLPCSSKFQLHKFFLIIGCNCTSTFPGSLPFAWTLHRTATTRSSRSRSWTVSSATVYLLARKNERNISPRRFWSENGRPDHLQLLHFFLFGWLSTIQQHRLPPRVTGASQTFPRERRCVHHSHQSPNSLMVVVTTDQSGRLALCFKHPVSFDKCQGCSLVVSAHM